MNGGSTEPADLGHFAGIFRALSELQHQTRGTTTQSNAPSATRPLARTAPASRAHSRVRTSGSTPTISMPLSDEEEDENSDELDLGRVRSRETVWAQDTIADYLSSSSNQQGSTTSRRRLGTHRSSEFLRSAPILNQV